MTEYKASRTLVKSPPELWSEVSEAGSLKRHLDQFGEIRITRLEPETDVAWEGESARGTVKLEPSGWGTRVILTAKPAGAEADQRPSGPDTAASTGATSSADAAATAGAIEAEKRELNAVLELGKPARGRRLFRRGLMRDFVSWLRGEQPGSRAPAETAVEPDDPRGSVAAPALALNSALESLGRAHHRPYSRA